MHLQYIKYIKIYLHIHKLSYMFRQYVRHPQGEHDIKKYEHKFKQVRQRRYNESLRRDRATMVTVEEQQVLHFLSVCM
jgi:hypothetical protein